MKVKVWFRTFCRLALVFLGHRNSSRSSFHQLQSTTVIVQVGLNWTVMSSYQIRWLHCHGASVMYKRVSHEVRRFHWENEAVRNVFVWTALGGWPSCGSFRSFGWRNMSGKHVGEGDLYHRLFLLNPGSLRCHAVRRQWTMSWFAR